VEKYSYDVLGEPTIRDVNDQILTTSDCGNPYMFTGRRCDPESGLYYYRARYYSPQIGRFLQVDPIGYQGGLNLYTYVENNPANLTDPLGLFYDPVEDDLAEGIIDALDCCRVWSPGITRGICERSCVRAYDVFRGVIWTHYAGMAIRCELDFGSAWQECYDEFCPEEHGPLCPIWEM